MSCMYFFPPYWRVLKRFQTLPISLLELNLCNSCCYGSLLNVASCWVGNVPGILQVQFHFMYNIEKHYVCFFGCLFFQSLFLFVLCLTENELATPPLDGIILPGVTRQSILDLARNWVSASTLGSNGFNDVTTSMVASIPAAQYLEVQLIWSNPLTEMGTKGIFIDSLQHHQNTHTCHTEYYWACKTSSVQYLTWKFSLKPLVPAT